MTLVPVVMVVAVMVLGLFFWLTVDFVLSHPPPFYFLFVQKKGGGTMHFLGSSDFG